VLEGSTDAFATLYRAAKMTLFCGAETATDRGFTNIDSPCWCRFSASAVRICFNTPCRTMSGTIDGKFDTGGSATADFSLVFRYAAPTYRHYGTH
jgi:hypothetical protein